MEHEPDEPDELTDLIARLEEAMASTCEDSRHERALAGSASAIRQLSELHHTILVSLDSLRDRRTAPTETPTPCTDPVHALLLKEAASALVYALNGLPDLLRTLGAQTSDDIDEIRQHQRELSKIMASLDETGRQRLRRSLV